MASYGSVALISFLIGLSGALMPGPMMLATITSSRKRGYLAGPLISATHAGQELVMVAALLLGATKLLANDRLIGSVSFAGAAVLAWMGVAAIKYSRTATLHGVVERPGSKLISDPFLAGIATTAGNPMWWVWWPTVGLSTLAIAPKAGAFAVAAFYLAHIAADFLVYSGLSAAVTAGRKVLRDAHFRFVIVGCGVFLVGFAGVFAAFGVHKIV